MEHEMTLSLVLYEERPRRSLPGLQWLSNRGGAGLVALRTPAKEKKWLTDLKNVIMLLKSRGLCGAGVIGAYHIRRVVPLMTCQLPMYKMVPIVNFDPLSRTGA